MTSEATPSDSRYESGLAGKVLASAGGTIASVIVAFMVTKFVFAEVVNVRDDAILIGIFFAVILVGLAITVVRVFVITPVRIVVKAGAVEIYKGQTLQHTLSRADYAFGSFVTRQASSNRVTERKLIATSATQRLEILCPGFTNSSFDDLIARLSPLGAAGLAVPTTVRGSRGGIYTLDAGARMLWLWVLLGILIVAVVATALGITALIVSEPIEDTESAISALVVIGLFIAVLGIPLALLIVRLARVRSIPKRIEVSGSGLVIGERVFPAGQLTRVSMTPDTYRGMNKHLTIVEGNRTRTRYLLETGGLGARQPVFAQYAQFSEELARCLPAGVVRYELG